MGRPDPRPRAQVGSLSLETRADEARFYKESKLSMSTTFIVAHKAGMTRIFREDGTAAPVTVLKVVPGEVVRQKTSDHDGYEAAVITAGSLTRECRGNDVTCDLASLSTGARVVVSGTGKGKGFAGTIKRHGFKRGPKSHGSKNVRKPGSIGSGYPQHVLKGTKMGGRMGGKTVTTRSYVEGVKAEEGLLLVRGAIPGSRGTLITLQTL